MFIKNKTASYQNFSLGKDSVSLAPGACTSVSNDHEKDDTLKMLISNGIIEKVKASDAVKGASASKPKAASDDEKMKVISHDERMKNQSIMVTCAAANADGTNCGVNIPVPANEYDSSKAYFCGRHQSENADDYEKVDGHWKKIVKPVEQTPAEPETKDEKPADEVKDEQPAADPENKDASPVEASIETPVEKPAETPVEADDGKSDDVKADEEKPADPAKDEKPAEKEEEKKDAAEAKAEPETKDEKPKKTTARKTTRAKKQAAEK